MVALAHQVSQITSQYALMKYLHTSRVLFSIDLFGIVAAEVKEFPLARLSSLVYFICTRSCI